MKKSGIKAYGKFLAKLTVIGIGFSLFYWSAAFWGELLQSKDQVEFYLEQPINGREAAEILRRDEEFARDDSQEKSEAISGFCIWGEKRQAALTNDHLSRSTEADLILFCGDIELLFEGCRVPAKDDAEGCLVDERTAWELFGDSQITGKEISYEEKPYIIRKVIPGERKLAVFPADSMAARTSGASGGWGAGKGSGEQNQKEQNQEEQNQEEQRCLSRITVLKPEEMSMHDLKSVLSGQYAVDAELLDLQLLRGVSGFFVLLVPVFTCAVVLRYFYHCCKRQQGWMGKAVMAAAALVLLLLAFFLIKRWVRIPMDYIPEKWSDFAFWAELWKEKAECMEDLIKIRKSILDMKWIDCFFKSIVLGILAEIFFILCRKLLRILL